MDQMSLFIKEVAQMKIKCTYRLTKNGAPIKSLYDTDTGLIDGIPASSFQCYIEGEWDSDLYYNTNHPYPECMLEAGLFYFGNAFLCVDWNLRGMFVFLTNGQIAYTDDIINKFDIAYEMEEPYIKGIFREVGYVVYQCEQLSFVSAVPALVYNEETGCIHINGKWYKVPYDSSIITGSRGYDGYKTAVSEGYSAVIYINEIPYLISENNGELVFTKYE